MRERILEAIYKKIEENPSNMDLQRQIILLNKSNISTIHSFCLDVIRNNFYEIDTSANFRVADTAEIELLKQEVIDDLFEERYLEGDCGFEKLLDTYTTYRSDEGLRQLILNVYKFIQSSPFPDRWIDEQVEKFNLGDKLNRDFSETVWGQILLKNFEEDLIDSILKLKQVKKSLDKYEELVKYQLVIDNDIESLENIKNTVNLWEDTYNKVSTLSWAKWPSDRKIDLEVKDEAKEIRDSVKKKLATTIEKYLLYDSKQANEDIFEMYDVLCYIRQLVIGFTNKFASRKKEKNIVDFNDIEHFALNILLRTDENGRICETDVARKYKEKFEEIAIDEYQDSNLVQEYILKSVSKGNNIFMVGDVKQSIYKFRQARPELFLEKYETYGVKGNEIKNGMKIQLFKNFRSRENVLDLTNLIFQNIMSYNLGNICYDENEFLNYGANYPELNNDTEDYITNNSRLTNATKDCVVNSSELNNDAKDGVTNNFEPNNDTEDGVTNNSKLNEDFKNYAGVAELDIIDLKPEDIDIYKDDSMQDDLEVNTSVPNVNDKKNQVDIHKTDSTHGNLKANVSTLGMTNFLDVTNKNNQTNFDDQEESDEVSESQERIEDVVLEAKYVAKRIKELINSNYMVYDRKKGYRKVTYKDIVVLLRSTKISAPIFEREISNLNMPVFSDVSSEYLESMEIQTIMSLLKIIDNPMQDIPLITVLRSSIGGFTDNELVEIRDGDKNVSLYESLKSKYDILKSKYDRLKNFSREDDSLNYQKGNIENVSMKDDKLNNQKKKIENVSVEDDKLKYQKNKLESLSTEEYNLKSKIEIFLNNLEKWQNEEKYMTLDELIWKIYSDTNYYNYVTLLPNGGLRQANLKMLFERAKQYESASFKGLFNFINFIDKLHSNSGDLSSAKLIGENENVIRIMSIHKSKGLEFPVVFLSCIGKQFNLQDLNDNIILHQDLGFGPKYINSEKKLEYTTLAKEAIRLQSKIETLSEEMRVLYVALTRAKEKIIITGMSKDVEKSFKEKESLIQMYKTNKKSINYVLLKKYKSYLDWIELVYFNNIDNIDKYMKVNIIKKTDLLKVLDKNELVDDEDNIVQKLNSRASGLDNSCMDELGKILQWKYLYMDSSVIPTKTSVTKLKELENEQIVSIEQIGIDNKIKSDRGAKIDNKTYESKFAITRPHFLDENVQITNAQKGTLMHLCFQKLDEHIDYTKDMLQQLVDDMVYRKLITPLEGKSINMFKLYSYTKSELFTMLKNAKKVYKEQPFYINLTADEIYHNGVNDNILVQGIIDLYFVNQNDEIILVDYKTDYVENGNENGLVEKYTKQLEIYKRALEQALDRDVDRCYIYSVYLEKLIEIINFN